MADLKIRKGSPRAGIGGWKRKPRGERACKECGAMFTGLEFYCSRKCQLMASTEKGDGCWTWTGYIRPGGYGEAYFGTKPNRERVLAHRAVYEAFIGDLSGKLVCHSCDNPSCVNPAHLFLGTIQDNMDDRNAKGRQARGEKNAPAKLTEAEVRAIRADERGCKKLSKAYGVHEGTIMSIRRGTTWKHVPMGGE